MLNFNQIIVTTDLSSHSLRALPYAIGLADRFEAELTVVSVNEPALMATDVAWMSPMASATDSERAIAIKDGLNRLIAEKVPRGVRASSVVLSGHPVDAIVEYANETNADLIIACTHGRGGLSHVLMGSTAEELVRRAPCPVLTLKQPMPVAATQHGG
jgi:nucleotide-binding universal stress UspA family protein